MQYRKFDGENWLSRTLTLYNQKYSIVSRRIEGGGGEAALAAEGRKAVVYKLRRSSGEDYALKVFHKKFALLANLFSSVLLGRYAGVAGLRVCKREVLLETHAASLNEPGLEWSILMPWVSGKAWAEIVAEREYIGQTQCIALARRAAVVLSGLEEQGLTHADISSSNVFVELGASPDIELIDVEDMHHAGFLAPLQAPAGTPGYNHPPSAKTGYWNPYGDRFAGAVLLSEMLTWHRPDIRAKSDELSYFHRNEMCNTISRKYDIMVEALEAHSREVAKLFRSTWGSASLQECPTLSAWREALAQAKPASPIKLTAAASLLGGTWPSYPALLSRKPLDFQTQLVSRFTCFECGRIVNEQDEHAESCSHHPTNVKPTLDLSGAWEGWRPTLLPSVGKPKKPGGLSSFVCDECGNYLLTEHKPTCSRYVKPTLHRQPSASLLACQECKNQVARLDGGRDHSVVCSKHPDYIRTRPSRFDNVRFLPLTDSEEKEDTPPAIPSLSSSLGLLGSGQLCQECKKWVVPGSTTFKHDKSCWKGLGGL